MCVCGFVCLVRGFACGLYSLFRCVVVCVVVVVVVWFVMVFFELLSCVLFFSVCACCDISASQFSVPWSL